MGLELGKNVIDVLGLVDRLLFYLGFIVDGVIIVFWWDRGLGVKLCILELFFNWDLDGFCV